MGEIRTIDSKSCKEIYVILNKLGLFYKLPRELKEYISENQSSSYEYDFNIDLPLIYQINNEKTKEYISYLFLKYINDNDDEKRILLEKYEKNEELQQEELVKRYNLDDIFKSRNKIVPQGEQPSEETRMTVVQKEKWYQKIFNLIKNIFHRN